LALMLGLAACRPAPQPVTPAVSPQSVTLELAPPISPLPSTLSPKPTTTLVIASPTRPPTATEPTLKVAISPENASRLAQIGVIRFDPWELVLTLAWSPDGDLLAVSAGNSIFLYNGSDQSLRQILEVGSWTSGLAFSPDGALLAAGSQDGELRLWRRPTDGQAFDTQPAVQWTAHKKGINQIAFSPDGFYLASGGNDAIARIWRVGDGGLEQQMIGGTFSVTALAFQPDGRFLAIVNGSLARLRALETGQIGITLRGDAPLFSLAFSPDGRQIATGNLNNLLEIWETGTGESIARLEVTSPAPGASTVFTGQVVYSPDGRLLGATASDGSVRLWEPVSGQLKVTLSEHSRSATCLAFSPDQDLLVSGGLDGTIRIWEIR